MDRHDMDFKLGMARWANRGGKEISAARRTREEGFMEERPGGRCSCGDDVEFGSEVVFEEVE